MTDKRSDHPSPAIIYNLGLKYRRFERYGFDLDHLLPEHLRERRNEEKLPRWDQFWRTYEAARRP